ncbi:MAG: hypothetical protein SWK90_17735 [Chloroflexota bacterium]|nr:hypothetical protein [Chloroflexota bacterium]
MTRERRTELAQVVALLLLAAWFRWRVVLEVPPGLEMDPLIEAQIAEQVLDGDWRPFYEAGQGREALYHYWLAIWLATLDKQVFTLRMASTFLSLLGLAAGYVLTRRLLGPAVALVGLAGGAISFWTVFAARSGLRSTILPPLAALAGYFFWRGISGSTSHCSAASHPQLATRSSQSAIRSPQFFLIYSGLCLGLSFYAYTAARVLPAVFGFFVLYLLAFHRHWLRDRWKGLALGAGIAVLVTLPLLTYLHAHPEADEFEFMDFDRPLAALEAGDPEPALRTSLATLGMFTFQGDPLIFDNIPGRPVFEPLGGMLFLIGVAIAVRRFRQPAYAFTLLWLLVGLVPGMLSQPAPNFYRTVVTQVVAFAFPGIAAVEAWHWLRRRWPQRSARLALFGGAILLLGLNLAWSLGYFTIWPTVEGVPFFWQTTLTEMARYLDRSPDTSPVALCTGLTYEHDPWWRPAWQSMDYLLHRSDLSLRYYDCADTMVFLDGPARYAFPDATGVDALAQFPAYRHFLATANIGLEFLPGGPGIIVHSERTPALSHLAQVAADAAVAWAPETGAADRPARVPINFGDQVEFLGYDLAASSLNPGASFDLVTYWRVTAGLPPQLSQFTHVLNAGGAIITQQDRLALTSASLRARDVFAQAHHLTLPGDLAEGEYPLTIGLYTPDGTRLPITQAGQPRGDRLWLRPIVVEK